MKKLSFLVGLILLCGSIFSQQKILFDNTKSEQAGNADWVIDGDSQFPSPPQSGISGNPFPNPTGDIDTYWSGALSMWAIEMVKQGYAVETLPSYGNITYNDATNSQDLSNYSVFIVCEPNNPFSSDEKSAMMNFVSNGGGLFIIANHAGADRDFDGWDALEVWNDFFVNNPIENNPFGFLFDEESNISAVPTTNIADLNEDPLLHGIAGDVDGLESHAGATMTINTDDNATVKAIVFDWSAQNTGTIKVLAAYATYGNGRVVGLTDSSFAEDDTPNGGTTYSGWIEPIENGGLLDKDNGRLITNATIWLSQAPLVSEPTNNASNFTVSNTTDNTCTLTWTDAIGEQLPTAYIIKAVINPELIIPPIDTVYENNTTFIKNIAYGQETVTFTELIHSSIYDFQIFSYSNSGTNVDYLLPSLQTAQGVTKEGRDVINYENFVDCISSRWHSYSVLGATDEWSCSAGYNDINGYNDEEDEDWLILSSSIDFDLYTDEKFTFITQERYEGPDLELFYSMDYSGIGDPTQAVWTLIPHSFNDVSSDGSFSDWSQNTIELSSLSGELFIAFKYNATSLSGSSEHWRIDDLKISGYLDIPVPIVSIVTVAGCDDTGSVIISSDQPGFQTFYLIDHNGNTISEWSGELNNHNFTGLSNGTYKGQVKKGSSLSEISDDAFLVNLVDPVSSTSLTASKNTICKGDSSTLSFIGGSGDLFNWYIDSCLGQKIGNGNLVVSPMITTSYYGSWENDCNTSTCQSVVINVNELIISSAGIDDSICDSTYQLSGNDHLSAIGTWTIVNGAANISDINLHNTIVEIESYPLTLQWTLVNGACTSQDDVVISLLKATSIITQPLEINSINKGDDILFSVIAEGENLNYQWQLNGIDVFGANSDTYTITSVTDEDAGNYTVVVSGDCGSIISEVATLSVLSAVVELSDLAIKIFPNPVSYGEYITMESNHLNDYFKLNIYNYLGQTVLEKKDVKLNEKIEIQLKSGLYYVRVNTIKGSVLRSLMVE